jgi:putative SOS response-associated peptidase YedK
MEVRIDAMCGRYAQTLGAEEIVESFDLAGSTLDQSLPLNWNIAPTSEIYIIRSEPIFVIVRINFLESWSSGPSWADPNASHSSSS